MAYSVVRQRTVRFISRWAVATIARQILCLGVTATHPTAEWLANQLTEACGWEQIPRCLIRDRDRAYGKIFVRRGSVDPPSRPVVTPPIREGSHRWLSRLPAARCRASPAADYDTVQAPDRPHHRSLDRSVRRGAVSLS